MRDGGILTIYALENVSEKGYKPEERLVRKCTAFFSYRTIGVNRLYAAIGANRQIDLLVRCWNISVDPAWEYVIINDEQYRIDLAQPTDDATDLTLTRIAQNEQYPIATLVLGDEDGAFITSEDASIIGVEEGTHDVFPNYF